MANQDPRILPTHVQPEPTSNEALFNRLFKSSFDECETDDDDSMEPGPEEIILSPVKSMPTQAKPLSELTAKELMANWEEQKERWRKEEEKLKEEDKRLKEEEKKLKEEKKRFRDEQKKLGGLN